MRAAVDDLLITQTEHERIQAHYGGALPYLERHFGGTPVIAVTFPRGFGQDAVFHELRQSTGVDLDRRGAHVQRAAPLR